MQRLHGQCPGVGSVSRKEDRPEGAEDGDPAPLRTVSPSGPPGSTRGPVRAQRRRVAGGSGYSKAREPGRASCLQGPGPERYSAAGPNPSASVNRCAAAPARRPLRSPDISASVRAGRSSLRGGFRGAWPGRPAEGTTARSGRAAGCVPAPPPPVARAAAAPPAPAQTAPWPAATARRSSGTRGRPGLGAGWAEGWGPTPGLREVRAGAAAWAERSCGTGKETSRAHLPGSGAGSSMRPSDTAGLATLQWGQRVSSHLPGSLPPGGSGSQPHLCLVRICESSQAAFGLGKDATLTPAGSPMRGPRFLWAKVGCPAGSGRMRCGQGPGRVLYVEAGVGA